MLNTKWILQFSILYLLFTLPTLSSASPKYFQGYIDSDWSKNGNWDGGGVPNAGDTVYIYQTCIMDIDASITLSSLFVSIPSSNGYFHITLGDTILINNTTAPYNSFYACELYSDGQSIIDGMLNIIQSSKGGIDLRNVTINGKVEVNNAAQSEAAYIRDLILNGELIIGMNATPMAPHSLRLDGTVDIAANSTLVITDPNKQAINVVQNSHITINEKISFPPNSILPNIVNYGTITVNDSLLFTPSPTTYLPTLINYKIIHNNSFIHFPTTNQNVWDERGTFTNEPTGYIKLDGRLYCNNNTAPPYYATITNKGIIVSEDNGTTSHCYSGSHTFNNNKGIVADPGGRFSSAFDSNTGVKTKKIDFFSCSPGELVNFYEGSMMDITSSPLYLDSLLTQPTGTYDTVTNSMSINKTTIGKSKFFVQLTSTSSGSITTSVSMYSGINIKAFYPDNDMDAYGYTPDSLASCTFSVPGRVIQAGDFNDNDESIHPNALEVCDGIDSNCDGQGSAEATSTTTFNGSSSSDWYTAGNWTNGLPDFCSIVTIDDNLTADLGAIPDTIYELIINIGAILTLNENLYINNVESTSLSNNGILHSINHGLYIFSTSEGTGILNNDSIYLNTIHIENVADGIENTSTGRIEIINANIDGTSNYIISNEGFFKISSPAPPNQGFVSISNNQLFGIINLGDFVFDSNYFGGSESMISDFIFFENYGNLLLSNYASFFPQNPPYTAFFNEGTLSISGQCDLYNGADIIMAAESNLILLTGGNLSKY